MAPEDTFFDDEDDTCPLCIEEFDLSDRNFRPCPCGYQICQFCFNNLKNNLNGLCPACRRPYDDKDVKWKVVTREEEAEFRANIQKNQKKRATEQRQKEAQRREAEKENRKNLQGVRVVQKNLVYVTGLTPTVREDELLKTLRKPEFFGQYVVEPIRKAEKQRAVTPTKPDVVPARTQPSTVDESADFGYFLRQLASCPAKVFAARPDPGDEFPPMFDLNGAARRRAMRDEDENRLGDQDDELDILTQSDGELESGSLALGGEPEDRDQARNGLGYDQRRNAPIQRGTSNDLFGPSLTGFGPASTTVGSIGSRTMTPQQQLFMRPQGSFTDQMPPGISPQQASQQTSLFQGQGHTRQQSRFSFANDNNGSSVNVKSSGDPRYMAQQSSMMPSAFRSQPGGQLYATSVSGPPPGLKSTGTPPVGSGMFGQGHAFGASTFGAASKGNPNDLLQSLIRGNVGNQAHDGKREYMLPQLPSFHSQFPSSTSSTPAPAPGLLATLYAPQPGAFPDYGPKQKKKGKKHRHANTSSSGGSGLVDLADPSILQARMHHQQQGNSMGAGQGLFSGQTQGGYSNPNAMYGGGYRW
ncbi:hypothetical protein ONZ43_g7595 [Nemania bipapillata]|uniref:Uncharacterized protein n=1 Tax=Nemania bipapillata TaxID=110536 RepID=A0ACC2HPQ7_9PEZI|nr:hypothetical protein ONZ43_g7595 [Nemania bipapillata]